LYCFLLLNGFEKLIAITKTEPQLIGFSQFMAIFKLIFASNWVF
jgi:hypothetical protein